MTAARRRARRRRRPAAAGAAPGTPLRDCDPRLPLQPPFRQVCASRSTLVARIDRTPRPGSFPLRRSRTTGKEAHLALFDDDITDPPPPAAPVSRDRRGDVGAGRGADRAARPHLPADLVRHPAARTGVQHAGNGREAPTATQVPLISVEGAETYPTDGALNLLTVQVAGNRERTPSWFELARAWFDPSKAVLPIDAIFPQGQTTEERNEESAAMMVDSQNEATAAALTELGYDVNAQISVHSLTDDSAADRHPRGRRRHPRGGRQAGDGCRDPARHRERRRRRARRDADRTRRRGADGRGDAEAGRHRRRVEVAHRRDAHHRLRLPDRRDHPAQQRRGARAPA